MKKLMIAAAAICSAAMVHAAAASWTAGDIYTFEGADKTSTTHATDYLVYYIDAGNYSYASAKEALGKGDIAFVKSYGVLGDGIADGWTGGTVSGYADGAAIDAYAVILNNADIDKATYAFLSTEDDTTKIGDKGQAAYPFFDTSKSNVGANWSAVAVPEPTSGLLLLLGVAGLALRRRRA